MHFICSYYQIETSTISWCNEPRVFPRGDSVNAAPTSPLRTVICHVERLLDSPGGLQALVSIQQISASLTSTGSAPSSQAYRWLVLSHTLKLRPWLATCDIFKTVYLNLLSSSTRLTLAWAVAKESKPWSGGLCKYWLVLSFCSGRIVLAGRGHYLL